MLTCLYRFAVAAAAFSPFLRKALASKRIWRGGLELGLWMGLGELVRLFTCTHYYCCFLVHAVPLVLSGALWKLARSLDAKLL